MSDAVVGRAGAVHLPSLCPPPTPRAAPRAPERIARGLLAPVVAALHRPRAWTVLQTVSRTLALEAEVQALDDGLFRTAAADAGRALRRRGDSWAFARCAALARESIRRETDLTLNRRQIQGAVLMWSGVVAEMATGEGKTLTAVLTAAAAALAGRRVHVVTVNDYLAQRDFALTAPIYARLGLRTNHVAKTTPHAERPSLYAAPIVYVCNAELAFDHLRDRTTQARTDHPLLPVLGGATRPSRIAALDFVIIDEADNVLVDDGRTPLILSGPGEAADGAETSVQALALAERLHEGADFQRSGRDIRLSGLGRARLLAITRDMQGRWGSTAFREETVRRALAAMHLFARDRDYVVRDGKVQIVDASTGRIAVDRSWSRGLHQLIEAREGVARTEPTQTVGRLTYQGFFARYRHVCGMTGTVAEVAAELATIYGLRTARVPTARPVRRTHRRDRVFATAAEQRDAIAARVAAILRTGAAVLVGTGSIAASQALHDRLAHEGIDGAVLNAANEAAEAAIIADAGIAGRVTIATSMAGRGVDIRPEAAVLAAGGLHVLLTERHASRRLDRQLIGRSARHGEPGHGEAILSLQDPILETALPRALRAALGRCAMQLRPLRAPLLRLAQLTLERSHARQRRRVWLEDHRQDDLMAMAGDRA